MHLAWFIGRGCSVHGWNQPWSSLVGPEWTNPDIYLDLVRALDRACFDYVVIEDGSFVPDAFRGSSEWYLRNASTVQKMDPMPLVPLLAQASRRLGIVATMTTAFYPPYLAARLGATLDHLTHGRVGLNLVTAHNDRSAQNFGLPQHHEHDLRYKMADEWIDIVRQLWQSWPTDAIKADVETGTFTDGANIRPIDFHGEYFHCRGPLNMPAGPQGGVVICQAGGSSAGKAFGVRNADTVIARSRGPEGAKACRDDVHRSMALHGRSSDRCKILFSTSIVLGETQDEAQEKN